MFDIGVLADYIIIPVVGFCLCIGAGIKSVNFIPNKFIQLILMIVGILANMWINDFIIIPEVILGGMLSGLASCGLYDMFVSLFIKGEKEVTENV